MFSFFDEIYYILSYTVQYSERDCNSRQFTYGKGSVRGGHAVLKGLVEAGYLLIKGELCEVMNLCRY